MIANAIFNIDGEYHHVLRNLMRENLMQPKCAGFVRMYKQLDKNFINEMKSENIISI